MRALILLLLLPTLAMGQTGLLWSLEEIEPVARWWPAGVEAPKNLKVYQRTQFSQRLVKTQYQQGGPLFDTPTQHRIDLPDFRQSNPNSQFPWAVPGGLHNAKGWTSILAIAIPDGKKIQVWREPARVPNSQPIPMVKWRFPDGTILIDILVSNGRTFEIRQREKFGNKWVSDLLVKARDDGPHGFARPDRACVDCHRLAGSSLNYGITIRGSDGVFSFSPLVEGRFEADQRWPVEVYGRLKP